MALRAAIPSDGVGTVRVTSPNDQHLPVCLSLLLCLCLSQLQLVYFCLYVNGLAYFLSYCSVCGCLLLFPVHFHCRFVQAGADLSLSG